MYESRRTFLAAIAALPLLAKAKERNIRVGCQANGWPLKEGDFDQLLGVLKEMREIGYTGFECNIRFVKAQFDNAPGARARIEATGVQFIGAHTSLEQSLDKDFARRAAGVAALGGQRIVMSAKGLSPEGRYEASALRDKAANITNLARICRENGVGLAYHNHNPEFANHNAEIEALASSTEPGLDDFLVDAGHAYLGGGDPARFAARHAQRIFGFHLKTFQGREEASQVPLGQGDLGFEKLASALHSSHWSGWLITEEGGGPKPGNTAAVRPDRDYIRRVFGV